MTHPYSDLSESAFWRSAVAEADPTVVTGLHAPKFRLTEASAIATAGSCFAQHVGRALRGAGLNVLDAEPAPDVKIGALPQRYGYGIYSARYGNIYTTRQFLQLLQDVEVRHVDEGAIWTKADRFYDALRPGVEPDGLDSADETVALRRAHLEAVARLLPAVTDFVFTLGLTETWVERATGRVYPTCPGVIAGTFDPARHAFLNLSFGAVFADLTAIRDLLHRHNPAMRMILTVSPVPLTATAAGMHVLEATARSKAVLRAAADEFAAAHDDVDYFAAYEIITNPAAAGAFFGENLREVTPEGVAAVMGAFLAAHRLKPQAQPVRRDVPDDSAEDVICEEILLEAFRK